MDEFMKMVPDPNKDNKEKKWISKSKQIDARYTFSATNFRVVVSCDICNAPHYIYPNNIVFLSKIIISLRSIILYQCI